MAQTLSLPISRRQDERGTSLVEFALVVTLLCTLLLGIVVFGVLLSKRQVLTQAAAEGARAAVPIRYGAGIPTAAREQLITNAAMVQINKSLQAMNRSCSDLVTTCSFDVFTCGSTLVPPADPTGSGDCLEVKVVVPVGGPRPLVPSVTLLGPFLPNTMSSTFTVTLANPT